MWETEENRNLKLNRDGTVQVQFVRGRDNDNRQGGMHLHYIETKLAWELD
jgi:hypothetical protein